MTKQIGLLNYQNRNVCLRGLEKSEVLRIEQITKLLIFFSVNKLHIEVINSTNGSFSSTNNAN